VNKTPRSAKTWLVEIWPWCAAALSGGLLALSLPRWNQAWLCWFGLAPLICALWFDRKAVSGQKSEVGKDEAGADSERRSWTSRLSEPLRKAALGYVAGATFFLTAFYWLINVHVIGWIAISLYLALFFAFWGWVVGCLVTERDFLGSGKNIGIALLCSFAWVAQEWVRGWLFSGFGWNGLGVALYKQTIYIQIAEFTGVAGLSFLIALCNLIFVITVRRFIGEIRRKRIRAHLDFSFTMVLIALVFSFGFWRMLRKVPTRQLKVAAVQANVPQYQKMDENFASEIASRYLKLTRSALSLQPQLLLWPESSVPGGMFANKDAEGFVKSFVANHDTNFILGTDDFDEKSDFNAAVLLSERGEKVQIYHKMHLVPFGEFIPFRHSFPLFAWIAGDLVPGDFKAGTEFTLLEATTPPLKIAPLICFEDTLGDLTRRFVLKGADLLVNVTNDGWFRHSAAAEQHLANAVFRTIETRRPLVRVANTGVTCFINHLGQQTQGLYSSTGSPFTQGVLTGMVEIPIHPETTFYVRFGDLFAQSCAAITAAAALIYLRRSWRK
jgi:apolipoprotein N-acyltransferase